MGEGLQRAAAYARATWKTAPIAEHISSIDHLHWLKGPLYVLVAGGIATGKTHVVSKYIKEIPVVDVDDFMEKLGYTDYTPRGPQLNKAMDITGDHVEMLKRDRRSLVAMGTASNFNWARQRLVEAKLDLYTTVLLHITTPTLEQAMAQNLRRRSLGKRAVSDEDIAVIEKTREASQATVKQLMEGCPHLVDYYVHHLNG